MMNSADPTQLTTSQRPSEAPTLWLSLTLGSVLIHLVLFILASIISTQTAKVQVDLEPVAVEFVEPTMTTVRSTAPSRAIAARPGTPSSTQPSSTQIRSSQAQQSSNPKQPIEQPLVPLQPLKRKPPPARPRPPQPSFTRSQPQPSIPTQPQPSTPNNSVPPQPDPNQPSQPEPSNDPTQPGNDAQPGSSGAPIGNGAPARSGVAIAEPPQPGAVVVNVSGIHETDDLHMQAASITSPNTVSISYPPSIDPALRQGITMEVHLEIDQYGLVQAVKSVQLVSEASTIDSATLNDLADQIFIRSRLPFKPAQDGADVSSLKPQPSDPTITAQIQRR